MLGNESVECRVVQMNDVVDVFRIRWKEIVLIIFNFCHFFRSLWTRQRIDMLSYDEECSGQFLLFQPLDHLFFGMTTGILEFLFAFSANSRSNDVDLLRTRIITRNRSL